MHLRHPSSYALKRYGAGQRERCGPSRPPLVFTLAGLNFRVLHLVSPVLCIIPLLIISARFLEKCFSCACTRFEEGASIVSKYPYNKSTRKE